MNWSSRVSACETLRLLCSVAPQKCKMLGTMPNSYLEETRDLFRRYKQMAESAMAQVTDPDLVRQLDDESNSIAIVVKHIGANLRSRFTDFLTTDGEKPDRRRDSEFEVSAATRDELMALWEAGWNALFSAVDPLSGEDLDHTVYIRGEAHSVLKALQRSLAHTASHVGQIVFLSKHLCGARWKTLSIPRGKSEKFTRTLAGKSAPLARPPAKHP
jgi:hypothetical protein